MKELYSLTQDNKRLVHSRGLDAFGFLRDYFYIEVTDVSGHRTIYPFRPPIKVSNLTPSANLLDATNEYEASEYTAMFDDEITHMKL